MAANGAFSGQANEIGYYYEPEDNFIVDQPGRYTVDLQVTYDGRTSAGQVTAPFPQGDVLGTARGRFSVYVVSPHSAPLEVDMPEHDFLTAPADFTVTATATDRDAAHRWTYDSLDAGSGAGGWGADGEEQRVDV